MLQWLTPDSTVLAPVQTKAIFAFNQKLITDSDKLLPIVLPLHTP